MNSTIYFAHSGQSGIADSRDWQLLAEHLCQVGALARNKAAAARDGLTEMAEVAGLLHDLGKYRDGFQRYFRGLPAPRDALLHKEAGSAKASEWKLTPVAFAIFGHHGGLPDKAVLRAGLAQPAAQATACRWPIAVAD